MKKYTIEDIRNITPCYDPNKYLPEDWQGTLIDMLQVSDCPVQDRIYVVAHFLDDKTNRLFAVACARDALKLVVNPDQRSVAACNVAERFAKGKATKQELAAARDAAWAAADAARVAARVAARDAARAAAWAAAAAAWDAAWAAAWDAAWAAADAAWDNQVQILISLINGSETTAAGEITN